MLENKLLSKVLDEKNFFILKKFNINADDFEVHTDVYRFIESYVREYGQTPDYRTVVEQFPDFEYMGEVVDAFPYLCKELKRKRGLRTAYTFLQNEVPKMFNNGKNKDFLKQLYEAVSDMYKASSAVSYSGSNYAVNGDERKERYLNSKKNRSKIFIPTPFETLNIWLGGGFELTDYVLIQAFSNVGKSWLASLMGVHAWLKGFGVMHYSPELSLKQQEARNDTLLGHFNNVKLRAGELENEEEYFKFLEQFKDKETPYIIKTMEHLPDGLSLDVIEADLQQNPNIKMVIIDGFNLMKHGNGKLDRNAMTLTSRRLRQIFGKYQVVGLVVHQVNASEERENKKKGKDDDGERLPKPASILGYSETLAVVQDASHILSFDAVDGLGAIQLVKTRGTGKDKVLNLNLNFNLGYIKETSPVDYF